MASVRYFVHDVDAAVAFYTERLGFVLRQQYGPAMARILDRADLTLWVAGPMASAARPMPDGRQPEPGGWSRFVLEMADLPALTATLKAAGVPFRNEIVVKGRAAGRSFCEDPSGNAIELFEPAG